jgi:myosin V
MRCVISPFSSICKFIFIFVQTPISPEILRIVAGRVNANDRNDHLLLAPESEEVGPYDPPLPRDISGLMTYVPAYLNVSHLRRLAALVA